MGVGGQSTDRNYADPRPEAQLSAELSDKIAELAAHINVAQASLAEMVADFDNIREWPAYGVRSPEHWLSITAGMDLWAGRELVRVGHALRQLPMIRDAFSRGVLSLDKVRALTRVARAEDEADWLEMARLMAGNQLNRLCKAYGRAIDAAELGKDKARARRRSLRTWWRDDGMLQVVAELPPAEGALLLKTLEAFTAPRETDPVEDEGVLDKFGARRSDALAEICDRALASLKDAGDPRAANREVVVHVDFDLLTGLSKTGRCHLEDGPSIALETAEMLGCGADVVAVIEQNGQVLDVRPKRRLFTTAQRRALALRDKTCIIPGCNAPAVDCEPHHVELWSHGGRTVVSNGASLCRSHHRQHHLGQFEIIDAGGGRFRVETPMGKPIAPPPRSVDRDPDASFLRALARKNDLVLTAATPAAMDRGAPFDLDLAVWTMLGSQRAGP